MNIIADTNIFLAVALDEPEKQLIIEFTAEVDAVSPEILPYEIGNALSAMIKRKQLTPKEALYAEVAANKIPVRLIGVDIQSALKIAIEHNIYAYDAYFLQSAKLMSYPLLTLDKNMKQVAKKLNIEVME
jgi:predicted nucleic acid-binding protein